MYMEDFDVKNKSKINKSLEQCILTMEQGTSFQQRPPSQKPSHNKYKSTYTCKENAICKMKRKMTKFK